MKTKLYNISRWIFIPAGLLVALYALLGPNWGLWYTDFGPVTVLLGGFSLSLIGYIFHLKYWTSWKLDPTTEYWLSWYENLTREEQLITLEALKSNAIYGNSLTYAIKCIPDGPDADVAGFYRNNWKPITELAHVLPNFMDHVLDTEN